MSDPASTPPAAPAPGPRRIRSLPDPVKGRSLLVAASTGHGEDANWRRGIGMLWVLFGALALAEGCTVLFQALAGYHSIFPLPAALRLVPLSAVFLALWLGWGGVRWLLAVFAFLFGAWKMIDFFRVTDDALQYGGTAPGHLIYNLPMIGGAVCYLALAGYLAFSSDATSFIKHRREEGRGWVVLPVGLLLAGYTALIFTLPVLCGIWVEARRVQARSFGRESLRAISQRWDLATFESFGDEKLLTANMQAARQSIMRGLHPFGQFQDAGEEISEASSVFDAVTDRFAMQGSYQARVRFTHGRAIIYLTLTASPIGRWRIGAVNMSDPEMDPPPAPAATPAPDVSDAATPAPAGP